MPKIDASALVGGFYDPPYPPVNPAVRQAEDETVEWLRRIGFITSQAQEDHLRSFEFGLYHGIATPEADHASLVLGLKWFCWGSLADDQYDNDDRGDRQRRTRGVLRDLRAVMAGTWTARTTTGQAANAVITRSLARD